MSLAPSPNGPVRLLAALVAVALGGAVAAFWRVPAAANSDHRGHPFHVTIAEVEYNPETNRFEVALRVDPLDLQQALAKRLKQPERDLERIENLQDHLNGYVADHFRIVGADGSSPANPLSWVGHEIDVKTAWLYFEITAPDRTAPDSCIVAQTMFQELEPNYVHTINYAHGRLRTTLRLTYEQPRAPLKRG
ncbi:hypothetical protein Isop_2230 [Isosphaera pallida ATCC 43644]|uniref:Uncharacterized protein n=1 Tax=Isosphaera pallida (strain ATCC 43644 / DSM 9630 / IS1B) TaxID=575540 RepID=E8R5Q1_ISOPI|nr:DUF6702 family protein [Isosphaera pallida]ADV62808.1 hypothetical protein Isop_2230 [Isosphaera pallida ATCC 43644]